MTRRKLQALRNLAERPGTEAEGKLARERLAEAEAKAPTGKYHVVPPNDPFFEAIQRDAEESIKRAFYSAFARDESSMREAHIRAEERRARNVRFFSDLAAKVGQDEINEVMADIERVKKQKRNQP